jgi:hypothetical protein
MLSYIRHETWGCTSCRELPFIIEAVAELNYSSSLNVLGRFGPHSVKSISLMDLIGSMKHQSASEVLQHRTLDESQRACVKTEREVSHIMH